MIEAGITKFLGLFLSPIKYVWHSFKMHERRKDLITFLIKWCDSELSLFNFLNNNLQSIENEIGRYRFDKLSVPLKEMKLCNLKRGNNGNLICATINKAPYDKRYIEDMIRDVKKGCQDKNL